MRRLALLIAAIVGLGFPAGLGLAVYLASGSSLSPPAASVRVPTGTIARPSTPPTTVEDLPGKCDEAEHRFDPECLPAGTTTDETTTDEITTDETTTDETTTELETTTETDSSGKGRGKGRGRGRGRGGDD
jgi:hypothetical protein